MSVVDDEIERRIARSLEEAELIDLSGLVPSTPVQYRWRGEAQTEPAPHARDSAREGARIRRVVITVNGPTPGAVMDLLYEQLKVWWAEGRTPPKKEEPDGDREVP